MNHLLAEPSAPGGEASPRVARIGIAGTGRVARHHVAAALALGHRIVAGSARSAGSPGWGAFQALVPDATFVADPADLLDDPDLDAVVVSLPWHVMPAWTARLLTTAKPLLIEKPLGLDAAAIARALGQPDARPSSKLIGYNRRHYVTVGRLRERLGQGGLKAVQVTVSEDLSRLVRDHGPAIVPHVLAFSSSHTLDLVLHLLGPLTIVRLRAHRERGTPGPFVSLNGLLETAGGIPVALALNARDPSPAGLRCLFDDGTTWHLSPLEVLTVCDGYEIHEARPGAEIRRYVPRAARVVEEPAAVKPGFLAQMRAFLSGEFGPGATAAESVRLHGFLESLVAGAQA
jgi:predicted dehydrogenase